MVLLALFLPLRVMTMRSTALDKDMLLQSRDMPMVMTTSSVDIIPLVTKQPVKFEYNNIKNDYNNARAVVDTHSPKGYGLEAYVDSKEYDNEVLYFRQGYGVPVKGYVHAHGDDYKFSGYNTPTTAGHYVGYGNKYDFRHGYPYGYGEMLDKTPAGYSLHSGSNRLITKQPAKYSYDQGYLKY